MPVVPPVAGVDDAGFMDALGAPVAPPPVPGVGAGGDGGAGVAAWRGDEDFDGDLLDGAEVIMDLGEEDDAGGASDDDDDADGGGAGAGDGGGEGREDQSTVAFTGHTDSVYSVAFHPLPSSKLAASGGGDDRGFLWRTDTGDVVAELGGHTDTVTEVAFSADGSFLATASMDSSVRLWATGPGAAGEFVRALEGPTEDVEWISWHSKVCGGARVAAARPRARDFVRACVCHPMVTSRVRACVCACVCGTFQGNVLLAGSADKTVWMWLAATGKFMQVFVGHEAAVTCGCFSGDGKAVLTGSVDSTVRVWNPKDGVCMHVFTGHGFHTGAISGIVAHHDRQLFLTAGQDGLACLANYRSGKILATLSHVAKDAARAPGGGRGGGGGAGGDGGGAEDASGAGGGGGGDSAGGGGRGSPSGEGDDDDDVGVTVEACVARALLVVRWSRARWRAVAVSDSRGRCCGVPRGPTTGRSACGT